MVRTTKRRGSRVLVIDFSYTTPDGRKRRYRRDAEVQTRTGALAEERPVEMHCWTPAERKRFPSGCTILYAAS